MIFPDENITAIILAGGMSRRMGFNKAGADLRGQSMLMRVAEKALQVTPNILISVGTISYEGVGYRQVPDIYPEKGPMGGLYSSLKASKSELNLVLSCDIPFVPVEILKHLVSAAIQKNAYITAPLDAEGQLQMLCAVYHIDMLPLVEQQIVQNELKMKKLAEKTEVNTVRFSPAESLRWSNAFVNVNTPEALKFVRENFKSR